MFISLEKFVIPHVLSTSPLATALNSSLARVYSQQRVSVHPCCRCPYSCIDKVSPATLALETTVSFFETCVRQNAQYCSLEYLYYKLLPLAPSLLFSTAITFVVHKPFALN